MSSSTPRNIVRTTSTAAAAVALLCLTAAPAPARDDPGPTRPQPTDGHCLLERVGTQFVRCDDLTGNGVPAPRWIPRSGTTTAWRDGPTAAVDRASGPTPTRTVLHVTTSGSGTGGFEWSTEEQVDATVECATFDATMVASVTDRFTVSLDPDGTITGVTETVSAPRSRWTNTRTGASVVVSGRYLQVATRIPGTHHFRRTVSRVVSTDGHPGDGSDGNGGGHETADDATWGDVTGQHRFADSMLTEPAPCAAIS